MDQANRLMDNLFGSLPRHQNNKLVPGGKAISPVLGFEKKIVRNFCRLKNDIVSNWVVGKGK